MPIVLLQAADSTEDLVNFAAKYSYVFLGTAGKRKGHCAGIIRVSYL